MARIEPASPGWDHFPRLSQGYVDLRVPLRLQPTYVLKGAEPNQTYTVGYDIFNLPDPGLTEFGVPREGRAPASREGREAMLDVFPVGKFVTDGNGDGTASFDLDLSRTPSGTYNLQFWWSRDGRYPVYYRTGAQFSDGLVSIIVP
jgi:hypothetical protein